MLESFATWRKWYGKVGIHQLNEGLKEKREKKQGHNFFITENIDFIFDDDDDDKNDDWEREGNLIEHWWDGISEWQAYINS